MSEHPEVQSAPTREALRERIARAIRMAQDGEFSPHGDVVTYGEMADAVLAALDSPFYGGAFSDVAEVRDAVATALASVAPTKETTATPTAPPTATEEGD